MKITKIDNYGSNAMIFFEDGRTYNLNLDPDSLRDFTKTENTNGIKEELEGFAGTIENFNDFANVFDSRIDLYSIPEMMVYIVEQSRYTKIDGYSDSWQLVYTFGLDKARKEAAYYYNRLTTAKKAKTEIAIKGYKIPCKEGQIAQECFDEHMENLIYYPDADFVEIYNESGNSEC